MSSFNKEEINDQSYEIIHEIYRDGRISVTKDNSELFFAALNKLKAYNLVQRRGTASYQLTKSGYNAAERGYKDVFMTQDHPMNLQLSNLSENSELRQMLKTIGEQRIIENDAIEFVRRMLSLSGKHHGDKTLYRELKTELTLYETKLDKLSFLYATEKELSNEFEKHLEKCQYRDELTKCPTNMFYMKSQRFIEQEIVKHNDLGNFTIIRPNINGDLVQQNLDMLIQNTEAANEYRSALDKLNEGKYQRNILDDLRLCLELIVQDVLKNNKSLENNRSSLGLYLKEQGVSKQLFNMFDKVLDYFTKYQNENVKHNNSIHETEVAFIINLSSAFINLILQID